MIDVIFVVLLLFIPFTILIGTVRAKYAEIYNPIRKRDNSDDELNFTHLKMTKTRNIFN